MATILLAATPLHGHVIPVVGIAIALRERGHQVRLITGAQFRPLLEAHRLEWRRLPDGPRARSARGILPWTRGVRDVIDHFVGPLGTQFDALAAEVSSGPYDAIVCDTGFLGVMPLLLGRNLADRPPVVGLSVTPISLPSIDTAPFGSALPPGSGPRIERRNHQIQSLLDRGPFRALRKALDDAIRPYGIAAGSFDYFAQVAVFNATYHLGLPELEYPRRELPGHVQLVGPLPALAEPSMQRPTWWPELVGSPGLVVHVTQGTLANRDPRRLLVPAIRALATTDALVVVTTGREPRSALIRALGGRLPANVRVAEFLPYADLLPHVDVLISNGGFGTVQLAIRQGIPVVVAGATEDKAETAARIAWSGAGVDLHSGRPSRTRIRRAVELLLVDGRFRHQARRIRDAADARPSPAKVVVEGVEALVQPGADMLTDPGR